MRREDLIALVRTLPTWVCRCIVYEGTRSIQVRVIQMLPQPFFTSGLVDPLLKDLNEVRSRMWGREDLIALVRTHSPWLVYHTQFPVGSPFDSGSGHSMTISMHNFFFPASSLSLFFFLGLSSRCLSSLHRRPTRAWLPLASLGVGMRILRPLKMKTSDRRQVYLCPGRV
jgi:hypothetical protein